MRQHIISSSNVHGIQAGNSSVVAIVAAHDVVTPSVRSWKRLPKTMVPASKSTCDLDSQYERFESMSESAGHMPPRCAASAAARCTAWQAAANEPPAAAWAALVIRRAISA